MATPTDNLIGLDDYADESRALFEHYLAGLVGIPTVSADPAHRGDIERAAVLATSLLTEAGFSARVVPTAGHPVVVGHIVTDPAAPTVLIYNHLDVQPATPDGWRANPYQLTIDGDRYYGRGATDDKGPAVTALLAARYAAGRQLPLNYTVVWEFEEEIGSPSFEEFLKGEPKLTADSVLVSDTIWLSRTKPAIPYALRGNVTFEVRLRTAKADAHSGLTGGIARNPLGELAAIITECYDATSGRVHVPGFYDDVKPPTAAELKSLAAAGFDQAEFARDHGLLLTRPGTDHKLLSQIVAEPTFEVHGIVGGYTGPGVKTVIPPEATAKLSARLVPGQKPRQVFEHVKRFIESAHPDTQVTFVAGLEPYLENPAGHYTAAASEAVEFGFGLKPVLIREGGSIGTLTSFTRHLHVPVVLMGLSLPEHGYHAPNEYFEWRQARGGIKMFAKYFANIASLKTRV